METRNTRAAIQQADANNFGLGVFGLQVIVIASMIGSILSSFLIGVIAFFVLFFGFMALAKQEQISAFVGLVLGIACGVAVGWIAATLDASQGVAIGVGLIVGAVAGGGNIAAMQAFRDLDHGNDG